MDADCIDWIKTNKAATNPVNEKDNKCLQDAVTVALNHEETGKHSEGINFPSEKNDSKKFQKNNLTIDLNVLYTKKEKNISCVCFKT